MLRVGRSLLHQLSCNLYYDTTFLLTLLVRRLWNIAPNNLWATKKENFKAPPTLREFLDPVIQEMDPEQGIEEPYKVPPLSPPPSPGFLSRTPFSIVGHPLHLFYRPPCHLTGSRVWAHSSVHTCPPPSPRRNLQVGARAWGLQTWSQGAVMSGMVPQLQESQGLY